MVLRCSSADTPLVFSSLMRVIRTASRRSRWRLKSQKQALRLKPPSMSMLKPLMPKRAESPWPPGKT